MGIGFLCPETWTRLCSGTHLPSPSIGSQIIQIKVWMLYLAHFSNKSRTPNFYSQIICPKHIKTAKIEQEERKATFHLHQTGLTVKTQTGSLEEMNWSLPTEYESILKSGLQKQRSGLAVGWNCLTLKVMEHWWWQGEGGSLNLTLK